jgi:hypothetical protein
MSTTADVELAVSPTTMLSHLHLLSSERYFTCFLVLKIYERLCEFLPNPGSIIVSLFSRIVDLENFDVILGAVPTAVAADLVNRLVRRCDDPSVASVVNAIYFTDLSLVSSHSPWIPTTTRAG